MTIQASLTKVSPSKCPPLVERVRRSPLSRVAWLVTLSSASGCLLASAFPPTNLSDAVWIGLIPFAGLVVEKEWVASLFGAYAGGLVFNFIGLDWMRTASQGAGGASAWAVTAPTMALTWPVALLIARTAYRHFSCPMSISLAAGWLAGTAAGSAISVILSGIDFPWLELAAAQVDRSWLIQLADLGGSVFISALIAFINGTLWEILMRGHIARPSAYALIVMCLVSFYGHWRLSQPLAARRVAVCLMPNSLPSPTALSKPAPDSLQKTDLLLWPESILADGDSNSSKIVSFLDRCSKWSGSPILIGWQRQTPGGRFNSAAFVDARAVRQAIYDKTCLVPWIEYVPWVAVPFSPERHSREFTRGSVRPILSTNGVSFGPAICYDACFPRLLADYRNCDFVAVCSSEISDTASTLRQSILQIVRLRAVELRRTIVRNAPGGYSGAVSSSGGLIGVFHDNAVRDPVCLNGLPVDERASFYAVGGPWSTIVVTVCIAIICVAWDRLEMRMRQWLSHLRAAYILKRPVEGAGW